MSKLFSNSQWEVTDYGLISAGPNAPYEYQIAARGLLDIRHGQGDLYEWPLQVCAKTWADVDEFFEGFEQAVVYHSSKGHIGHLDSEKLSQTREAVEHKRRRSEEFRRGR